MDNLINRCYGTGVKVPDSSGCRDVELVSLCHCRFSCEKAKQSEEAESEYLHRGVSDLAYITVRIILSARIFYYNRISS